MRLVPHCNTFGRQFSWIHVVHRDQAGQKSGVYIQERRVAQSAPSAWPPCYQCAFIQGTLQGNLLSEPQVGSVTRLGQDTRILCLQGCPHSSNETSSSRPKITEKRNWYFTYLFLLYLQLFLRGRKKSLPPSVFKIYNLWSSLSPSCS